MDNQHKKIKGYRDLTQVEIDLMNEAKLHAEKTADILSRITAKRDSQHVQSLNRDAPGLSLEQIEESQRCLKLAKDHLQTGQMWLVRAVALPDSF